MDVSDLIDIHLNLLIAPEGIEIYNKQVVGVWSNCYLKRTRRN